MNLFCVKIKKRGIINGEEIIIMVGARILISERIRIKRSADLSAGTDSQ